MISKVKLQKLYFADKLSQQEIAHKLRCSVNKVSYWMQKFNFPRRPIAEAVYIKKHPHGDPFLLREPRTLEDAILFGLGVGIFWGEGTKANKHSIRVGNTDPDLIRIFILFLERIFSIKRSDFQFGLQIFSDINETRARNYWVRRLGVRGAQFFKTTITPFRSLGSYRKKSQYGVLTIYYHNVKLRSEFSKILDQYRQAS